MEAMFLPWEAFKTEATRRNLNIQEFAQPKVYTLCACDGLFKITTRIHRDGDMTAECTDYETNYQAEANMLQQQKVVRVLSEREIITNPRTLMFDGAGDHYKKMTSHTGLFSLRGGILWVPKEGWDFGDTVAIKVIDRDDVLGLGATPENPFVLGDYIEQNAEGGGEWGVMPDVANALVDEILTDPMPEGLYVHLKYIKANGGTNTPKGIINLFTYET